MEPLPPIPTPPTQLWREFRIQVVPLVVFVIVVAAVLFIWKNYIQPVSLVGSVESVVANVISVQDGSLVELTVDRLDRVNKDDPIGRLVTTDPHVHEANLNQIAADLELMQARMGLDKIRNMDSYSRLQFDLLREEVALRLAQTRLRQTEWEYQRQTKLFQEAPASIVSEAEVEIARRDRDSNQAEIDNRTKTIAKLEQDLERMRSAGADQLPPRDPVIEKAIRAQQEVLALTEKPITLRAPIDGMVSVIYKRPGEKIVRGEPIVSITPLASDRIVGYLRQPLTAVPTTNDIVRVRSRSSKRQIATARILKVGTQLELINPLLISPDATRQEVGLPILVGLPPGMSLLPGEFVDLSIQPSRK
jgi:multidrug resistance efflux pump